MSLANQGLRTAIYKVADLDRAKAWYGEAFGSEPYFDEPFYVGFNIGGYELGLVPSDMPGEGKTVNVSVYWGVDDIEGEVARLVKMGATEFEQPANVGGPIVVAMVKDPWGNAIGLIYNPTFESGS